MLNLYLLSVAVFTRFSTVNITLSDFRNQYSRPKITLYMTKRRDFSRLPPFRGIYTHPTALFGVEIRVWSQTAKHTLHWPAIYTGFPLHSTSLGTVSHIFTVLRGATSGIIRWGTPTSLDVRIRPRSGDAVRGHGFTPTIPITYLRLHPDAPDLLRQARTGRARQQGGGIVPQPCAQVLANTRQDNRAVEPRGLIRSPLRDRVSGITL